MPPFEQKQIAGSRTDVLTGFRLVILNTGWKTTFRLSAIGQVFPPLSTWMGSRRERPNVTRCGRLGATAYQGSEVGSPVRRQGRVTAETSLSSYAEHRADKAASAERSGSRRHPVKDGVTVTGISAGLASFPEHCPSRDLVRLATSDVSAKKMRQPLQNRHPCFFQYAILINQNTVLSFQPIS